MPKELAKQYAPQGTEDRIYQNWCDKGYFHTQIDRSKKPSSVDADGMKALKNLFG